MASRSDADARWLLEAIELSRRCPPSRTAYSVGAVLVTADGRALSAGYSRETGPADHAEEVALARLGLPGTRGGTAAPGIHGGTAAAPGARGAVEAAGARAPAELAAATLYSSLEPCAVRTSRPVPCADLIIASGVGRVAFAWTEPPVLAPGGGAARLRAAGIEVVEVPELAATVRAVNQHLLRD